MSTDNNLATTRRLVVSISIAAMVSAMTLGEASACACCETYAVVGVASWDRLNIRSGPGVQYDVIGSFGPNDRCIVLHAQDQPLRRVGNWVQLPDGGWVNIGYLQYRHDG